MIIVQFCIDPSHQTHSITVPLAAIFFSLTVIVWCFRACVWSRSASGDHPLGVSSQRRFSSPVCVFDVLSSTVNQLPSPFKLNEFCVWFNIKIVCKNIPAVSNWYSYYPIYIFDILGNFEKPESDLSIEARQTYILT